MWLFSESISVTQRGRIHAYYGGHEITVEVASGRIAGHFPPRSLTLVQEWRELHRAELLEAWALARARKPLQKIDPLE
jgi:hypothetical protein